MKFVHWLCLGAANVFVASTVSGCNKSPERKGAFSSWNLSCYKWGFVVPFHFLHFLFTFHFGVVATERRLFMRLGNDEYQTMILNNGHSPNFARPKITVAGIFHIELHKSVRGKMFNHIPGVIPFLVGCQGRTSHELGVGAPLLNTLLLRINGKPRIAVSSGPTSWRHGMTNGRLTVTSHFIFPLALFASWRVWGACLWMQSRHASLFFLKFCHVVLLPISLHWNGSFY